MSDDLNERWKEADLLPESIPIGSNRHRKKKVSFAYSTLGGQGYQRRSNAHRQGNQKKIRYEEVDTLVKDATKKVKKKVFDGKSSKTLTGQKPDIIDLSPTHNSMVGIAR
jgi:hypothetical protein